MRTEEGPATDPWVEEVVAHAGDRDRVLGWVERLPPGYRERTTPAESAEDLAAVDALAPTAGAPGAPLGGAYNLRVRPAEPVDPADLRLRRTGHEAVELTAVLPVLESFGLAVTDAVPQLVAARPGEAAVHFDDFGLRVRDGGAEVDVAHDGARLVAAIEAVAAGRADVDGLNALVTVAGLDWRQVVVLRAWRRFRRQATSPWTDEQLEAALVDTPAVAAGLVRLLEARLSGPAPATSPQRAAAVDDARGEVLEALGSVERLATDEILRGYLQLADATLRTNWYRDPAPGTIVLKIDSGRVAELPRPRPHVESFVHGPDVEAVHLRMGPVARGGIRWSTRPSDVRTEVLALADAQTKKNAIIVPTGAKGGFVVRRPGVDVGPSVLGAYRTFISSLLDITDDVAPAGVAHPAGVVAPDGDDPYLVVAADKGTATFSDEANALAEGRGFWLGDAFASGGSHGYDHKAMGITARGAWVAVRRHFRQLGIDVQRETIRVVGVGDMSGDVFGNGMLLSRAIALVAAFDHRHVFLDPRPDPERSFHARKELFDRPRSSWADYDPSAISAGGGVWPRDAKEIPLSPEARAALGVSDEVLRPPEVIAAILAAPVDLLWFGGIGTYVKDAAEADSEVGDHANDAVRITADRVRARVVAEGANLGITQRARIRYSRRGGRINADFIDNAAGVATSDREVNLKILLGVAAADGRVAPGERDALLAGATDEVAAEVLRQVDHSVAALDRAVPDSARCLDAHVALLERLEAVGLVDRQVESLPGDEELAARRAAGGGFARPELAALLAHAKTDLVRELLASPVVGDPALVDAVLPYFPEALRARAGDLVPRHRLYRELAATDVAGELVDTLGPVWAPETASELGRTLAEVAGAFWAARQVTGAGAVWAALERAAEDGATDADAEAAHHAAVAGAVAGLARAYLRRAGPLEPGTLLALDGVAAPGGGDLAAQVAAAVAAAARAADAAPVARATGAHLDEVTASLGAVDGLAPFAALGRLLAREAPARRWAAWQQRALADDLADLRRAVAATARGAGGVAAWADARAADLERAGRLLRRVEPGEELTVAALALRALAG